MHFSLENSLVNTAGTIHRCGKLRIELILLLATMINRGYPTVIQAMIDNRIIDLVLVGSLWCVVNRPCLMIILGIVFFIMQWAYY